MPVEIIPIGDPAVLASDAVTLLVHASVTRSGRDRHLAFSVRPYRTSAEPTAVLFGAPPRVAKIEASGASPALAAALATTLSETLPWLAPSAQPQLIN